MNMGDFPAKHFKKKVKKLSTNFHLAIRLRTTVKRASFKLFYTVIQTGHTCCQRSLKKNIQTPKKKCVLFIYVLLYYH